MKKALLFLISLCIYTQAQAQLYINEWMASNSSIIDDPDFGDSGDWIELFNNNTDSLDLSGYFITDNFNNRTKWTIPSETKMGPNEFLIIWADGKDTLTHTSFKLSKASEEIALYNSDTILLDSIIYGPQQTQVSMGRTIDGANTLSFFLEPTPGTSNNTYAYDGITFYRPHFSVKGGFYANEQTVTLTTIAGDIRYTLDGRRPTLDDPLYTEPLTVNSTTNLRAAVFINNYIPGKPNTNTYFVNENLDERPLPVVSISTDPDHFWDPEIGLYMQDFKPPWEYPINIELFENDGSDRAAFNELAGIRINGSNSWQLPQKMLGIYFDNEYENNNLEYPLFYDRDRREYDTFTLRASGNDWSNTLFRDAFGQALATENMPIEHMDYRPSIVFINGEYMGIHNMRSRIGEGFIEENFDLAGNEYDLIENHGIAEQGDTIAHQQMYDLVGEDLTNEANFQAVADIVDLDNFTDYFIAEIWAGNGSYGHNVKLWKPRNVDSKWRWILQDLDRGMYAIENNGLTYFTTGSPTSYYVYIRGLLSQMLSNENFSDQFAQRFTDHMYTTFHPLRVRNKLAQFRDGIKDEIPYHVQRWGNATSNYGDGIASVDFWESEVEYLSTYAGERHVFLIDDIRDFFELEDEVNLNVSAEPGEAGNVYLNGLPIPAFPWVGPYFKNMPFELEAVANAGEQFEGWTISTFETAITKSSTWKYLDDGSNQNTAWRSLSYNDNSWASGQAEIGYGDGDETTQISYGNDPNNKHITAYFRKDFVINNLPDYNGQIQVNLKRDDGAVVYLNGEEILRTNMPDGDIAYDDLAVDAASGTGENLYTLHNLTTELLEEGENVIAVEVHQNAVNSSDLSFDLELKVLKIGNQSIFSADPTLSVNLSADTFFIAHFLPTGECLLPREITENTTLTIDCSPYLAPDDVTVFENITLTVDPGVEIHFAENRNLTIHGDLQIQASEAAPVILKSINDGSAWGGLIFNQTQDTSYLNWVEIIDASNGQHPVYENAAISAFYANVNLNHLTINNVFNNPILGYYSNIVLRNSELHSRVTGDLINVKYGYGLVENCDLRGNDKVDTDAIDYDEVTNGVIRNNKIYDFLGFNSDGIDIGEEAETVFIENNFLHNIVDKGVSIGQRSDAFVQNNTFINCTLGFGIKDLAFATIDQNTFYNVVVPVSCYEKNPGVGGGAATISNSILSNSPDAPYLEDQYSAVTITNSLSDTAPLPTDNLFENPHFENPTQFDFQLQSNSPAILAGQDDTGQIIDLGTKSHLYSGSADILFSAIHYNPEVDADAEFLQITNPSDSIIDLTGYTLSEGLDFIFPAAQIAPGETIWLVKDLSYFPDVTEQIFQWTLGRLSNNGETIRLTDSYGIVRDQVTFDDEAPWPVNADGGGSWLILISEDLDNHFGSSWQLNDFVNTNELPTDATYAIYPNPAKDFIYIEANETPIKKVEIINALGQTVLTKYLADAQNIKLDISTIPTGVLFVKINDIRIAKTIVKD